VPPLRIATANLENLDDHPEDEPPLTVRLPYLKAGLNRLRADIVCLQEIHGQDLPGGGRELTALDRVLEGTPYERFERASTETADGIPYRQRNLVVLSRFPIRAHQQIKHRFAPPPLYRQVTAQPEQPEAKRVEWERPILHCEIELDPHRVLHVIVVHLKSRMPSPIEGQGPERFMWKSAAGWAEGYFISSMKRVGQAFELRAVIDTLFDADEQALITVVGDFNSDVSEVPVLAILGRVEDTGNTELGPRVLLPCEQTVPEPSRYSLFHQGKPNMLDHILVSRPLLQFYRSTEIHNETLHDESIAFATDVQYPEPDHAPIVAEFDLTS
jgi:endonuclease/exonuclease/phosphatase family metal-dependent hydrolase